MPTSLFRFFQHLRDYKVFVLLCSTVKTMNAVKRKLVTRLQVYIPKRAQNDKFLIVEDFMKSRLRQHERLLKKLYGTSIASDVKKPNEP